MTSISLRGHRPNSELPEQGLGTTVRTLWRDPGGNVLIHNVVSSCVRSTCDSPRSWAVQSGLRREVFLDRREDRFGARLRGDASRTSKNAPRCQYQVVKEIWRD